MLPVQAGASVDPVTNRCPDNGARVDISDCSINADTGAAQLAAVWTDPDFDPEQRAFYYARVIENPTCRWSTWDAVRAGSPVERPTTSIICPSDLASGESGAFSMDGSAW